MYTQKKTRNKNTFAHIVLSVYFQLKEIAPLNVRVNTCFHSIANGYFIYGKRYVVATATTAEQFYCYCATQYSSTLSVTALYWVSVYSFVVYSWLVIVCCTQFNIYNTHYSCAGVCVCVCAYIWKWNIKLQQIQSGWCYEQRARIFTVRRNVRPSSFHSKRSKHTNNRYEKHNELQTRIHIFYMRERKYNIWGRKTCAKRKRESACAKCHLKKKYTTLRYLTLRYYESLQCLCLFYQSVLHLRVSLSLSCSLFPIWSIWRIEFRFDIAWSMYSSTCGRKSTSIVKHQVKVKRLLNEIAPKRA